jgi:hypothetical protein
MWMYVLVIISTSSAPKARYLLCRILAKSTGGAKCGAQGVQGCNRDVPQ